MVNKTLSIVIPVYNHYKYTMSCLASILKSSFPKSNYEIIIVDNASTDMTQTLLPYLQEQGEPIKILRNEENKDYLLGANQGWKQVKTPYCLHLNNDVILDKNCIRLMIDTFAKDPKIGVVGAVQYFPNGYRNPPLRFLYRGKLSEPTDHAVDILTGEVLGDLSRDVGNSYTVEIPNENADYMECDVVGFGCAMLKKEVWETIGYYDEQYAPSMYEEDDYCLRMKEAGYEVVVVPKATCIHYVAVTTEGNRSYYQSIISRNKELFIKKWAKKLEKGLV